MFRPVFISCFKRTPHSPNFSMADTLYLLTKKKSMASPTPSLITLAKVVLDSNWYEFPKSVRNGRSSWIETASPSGSKQPMPIFSHALFVAQAGWVEKLLRVTHVVHAHAHNNSDNNPQGLRGIKKLILDTDWKICLVDTRAHPLLPKSPLTPPGPNCGT